MENELIRTGFGVLALACFSATVIISIVLLIIVLCKHDDF